ncbi:hypothetical protein ASPVEDRAFT_79591 [Aspergillus versicolor CBS 583.65]|uniref:Uncharacterized protein n=1 Tax=Aspergillus versicolor CBS 583.65 TaxID=1036611 RepID=A0A1L9P8U1_ASPVE|nr:uncharacterized protein ASPVEDRAFT_79591 [Aspergillus versicolor CBS 583.65]OJI97915.1 hypothetical protein ASPVEDRAFT_79591 [Aspergillus versicolor CBS 583.65]
MPGRQENQDNEEDPDPDHVAAEARRHRHALLLLVETLRKSHPSETFELINAIKNSQSVPEAAELLMQMSDAKTSGEANTRESGSRTQ